MELVSQACFLGRGSSNSGSVAMLDVLTCGHFQGDQHDNHILTRADIFRKT